jgi:hypothetical protein
MSFIIYWAYNSTKLCYWRWSSEFDTVAPDLIPNMETSSTDVFKYSSASPEQRNIKAFKFQPTQLEWTVGASAWNKRFSQIRKLHETWPRSIFSNLIASFVNSSLRHVWTFWSPQAIVYGVSDSEPTFLILKEIERSLWNHIAVCLHMRLCSSVYRSLSFHLSTLVGFMRLMKSTLLSVYVCVCVRLYIDLCLSLCLNFRFYEAYEITLLSVYFSVIYLRSLWYHLIVRVSLCLPPISSFSLRSVSYQRRITD